MLQNSQENLCARVSFLMKLQLKKRLWYRCFPVNIVKFLRTPFSVPAVIDYTWYDGLPLQCCDKIVVKRDIYGNIFVVVYIHIVI